MPPFVGIDLKRIRPIMVDELGHLATHQTYDGGRLASGHEI
jgi:hypothetical protein